MQLVTCIMFIFFDCVIIFAFETQARHILINIIYSQNNRNLTLSVHYDSEVMNDGSSINNRKKYIIFAQQK